MDGRIVANRHLSKCQLGSKQHDMGHAGQQAPFQQIGQSVPCGGGGLGGTGQLGRLPLLDCGVWAFLSTLNATTLGSWQAGFSLPPSKAVTTGCIHAPPCWERARHICLSVESSGCFGGTTETAHVLPEMPLQPGCRMR